MRCAAPSEIVPDRVHGRRRGRRLRLGQRNLLDTLLPRIATSAQAIREEGPSRIFEGDPAEIWLEIGFGGGEHLAWQAAENPAIGLIGCEVFENGIVGLLNQVRDGALGNVRIVPDDARPVLDALPDRSIARAFVLFPDPWPKARHHKRRMVSAANLARLARAMRDGAELRLATDDTEYLRLMLGLACTHPDFEWLARRPSDWRERPGDWPQTRYEAKAIAAGRRPYFLRLRRRPRPD